MRLRWTIGVGGIFAFLGSVASADTIMVTPADTYELIEGARPGLLARRAMQAT